MLFYSRNESEIQFLMNRAYFEAGIGRVATALALLRDLGKEFPSNPSVCFAESTILRDYAGKGIEARGLFQKTYRLAFARPGNGRLLWYASFSAVFLCGSREEMNEWIHIARKHIPLDQTVDRNKIDELSTLLSRGTPIAGVLASQLRLGAVTPVVNVSDGMDAAVLEILLNCDLTENQKIDFRLRRAMTLRALDAAAERRHQTRGEMLPPQERVALLEALAEMERLIAADGYEAQYWNYKSAWCVLLRRPQDAILAAERAIALRPSNYPRPYLNIAASHWMLGRDAEALATVRLAATHAVSSTEPDVHATIRECTSKYGSPRQELRDWCPHLMALVAAARRSTATTPAARRMVTPRSWARAHTSVKASSMVLASREATRSSSQA